MKKTRVIQIIREEIEKVTNEDYKPSLRGYNVIDKSSGEIIDSNLPKHMALALAAKKNGWMIQSTDQLAEDEEINEMATFYKTKGDKGAAKAALKKAKEKYKVGTALYNTLDTLEKKGEIDYKALSKETGKDVASYNNPKSIGVLEKDLADFIEFEVGKRGRKADPNAPKKVKSAKKEKQAPKKNKKDEKSEISYSTSSGTMTTTKDATDKEIKKATKAIIKSKTPRKLKSGGDTDIKSKLDTLITDMKAKAKEYKESEGAEREKITKELKKMTAEKTQLMDKYDDSISDMDKNQELN